MLVKKRDIQTYAYMNARISKDNTYKYPNREGTADFEVQTAVGGSESIAH